MSLAEFLNTDKLMVPLQKFNFLNNKKKDDPYDLHKSSLMTYADLINAESALGRTIFGPIPAGHQREFFVHKKNIWVWHEGWFDEKGEPHNLTIRYEVKPEGVFKLANGKYVRLRDTELDNFCNAVRTYYKLVKTNLYH